MQTVIILTKTIAHKDLGQVQLVSFDSGETYHIVHENDIDNISNSLEQYIKSWKSRFECLRKDINTQIIFPPEYLK